LFPGQEETQSRLSAASLSHFDSDVAGVELEMKHIGDQDSAKSDKRRHLPTVTVSTSSLDSVGRRPSQPRPLSIVTEVEDPYAEDRTGKRGSYIQTSNLETASDEFETGGSALHMFDFVDDAAHADAAGTGDGYASSYRV
jgi:hypothetical protein